MTNSRVFISYAFVDTEHPDYQFAQRLAEDLRRAGADVIVDIANIGEKTIVQPLNRILPSCQWLIVIQSPEALKSLRVQMSVSTALHLITQQQMRNVLMVNVASCGENEVPLGWEKFPTFDATIDYQRALARMLLTLDLQPPQVNPDPLLATQFAHVSSTSSIDGEPIQLPTLKNNPYLSIQKGEDRPTGFSFNPSTTPLKVDQLLKKDFQDQPNLNFSPVADSKRNKKGLKASKRKYTFFIIPLSIVLILIIVATGVLYSSNRNNYPRSPSLPPAATITITPISSILKNTFDIKAVLGTPDTSNRQVMARTLSYTTTAQKQIAQTTGKITIPATASTGTLTYSNAMPYPQTFYAGSSKGALTCPYDFSCQSGSFHSQIWAVLDATITVPASPNGCCTSASGPAHAQITGGGSNFPANVMGYNDHVDGWTVENGAFTGGHDAQTFSTVAQSDIDRTAHVLIEANTPNPQRVLQSQIRPNEQFVGTPECKPGITSDHAAGDQATTVTVTVSFTCTGKVYDHDGAMLLSANLLNSQASKDLGTGFALSGKVMTNLTKVTPQATPQNSIELTITVEGFWVYQFDAARKQKLLKMLSGKSKQVAEALLLQQRGVRGAQVSITVGEGNSLPTDISRISLNITSVMSP